VWQRERPAQAINAHETAGNKMTRRIELVLNRISLIALMLAAAGVAQAGILMPLDGAAPSTILSSATSGLGPVVAGIALILIMTAAACARGGPRRPRNIS
jgi:hypothetical protein